jgi:glycosyltransferase involved in cell wall biosynthesis
MVKILYLSDSPFIPTGYGKVGRDLLIGLRDKGHQIIILGGSLGQIPFQPQVWNGMTYYPVKDYGNIEHIRFVLKEHKPDVMIINSDPRHLHHVFEIDNEIRKVCPLVFYHLWDDSPFPKFNVPYYRSTDTIIAGSKFVYNLLKENYKDTPIFYVPMGINTKVFDILSKEKVQEFKKKLFQNAPQLVEEKFIIGYVGRNILRKRVLDLYRIFSKFAKDKNDVLLFLHTSPFDPEGSNLLYFRDSLYPNLPVAVSEPRNQDDSFLALLYNMFSVSINIAHAEGFGLPLAESMSCGTPCIAARNAGPEGLITAENGWLVEPKIYSIFGTPQVPFINQRFVTDKDVLDALENAYLNKDLLKEKASKCRQYIVDNYSSEKMVEGFEKVLKETVINYQKYPNYTITTFPQEKVNE